MSQQQIEVSRALYMSVPPGFKGRRHWHFVKVFNVVEIDRERGTAVLSDRYTRENVHFPTCHVYPLKGGELVMIDNKIRECTQDSLGQTLRTFKEDGWWDVGDPPTWQPLA